MEFARNGRYLAIGDSQGRVSLLKSDTLDEVKSFVLEESSGAVSALHWTSVVYEEEKQRDASATFNPLDFSVHLRTLESLNPNLSQAARDTLALLDESTKVPSVLIACDENSTIQLMFSGNFSLSRFSLPTLIENADVSVKQNLCRGGLALD